MVDRDAATGALEAVAAVGGLAATLARAGTVIGRLDGGATDPLVDEAAAQAAEVAAVLVTGGEEPTPAARAAGQGGGQL